MFESHASVLLLVGSNANLPVRGISVPSRISELHGGSKNVTVLFHICMNPDEPW